MIGKYVGLLSEENCRSGFGSGQHFLVSAKHKVDWTGNILMKTWRFEWNKWNSCTVPCTKSNTDVACRNVSQPLIEWRLIVLSFFSHWITLRMQLTVHPGFEQHKSLLSCEHMALRRVVCQYEARTWGEYYQHSEINGINEHYSPLPACVTPRA